MKGTIIDYRIRIKPSKKLLDFILSLENEEIMTENILKIIQSNIGNNIKRKIIKSSMSSSSSSSSTTTTPIKQLNKEQMKFLDELELNENDFENLNSNIDNIFTENTENNSNNELNNDDSKKNKKYNKTKDNNKIPILDLNDLKWIKQITDKKRENNSNIEYLHELLDDSKLLLPENEIIPRDPILEARCEKLKAQRDAKKYHKMTKDVDTVRKDAPDDSIGYQLKAINKQLIAIMQFVFSIAAGFSFGFTGVELIIGDLDYGFRLLLGVMCSLIIALAEIYFLAKKLNEYDDIIT